MVSLQDWYGAFDLSDLTHMKAFLTKDDAGRAAGRRDWDALERAILDAVAEPKPNANPETNE